MKKTKITFVFTVLAIVIFLSGCLEITNFNDGSITYSTHPTKVSYTIDYGYYINTTGSGSFDLNYDCYTPADFKVQISESPLYNFSYQLKTISNNKFYSWDITDSGNNRYKLGISATIESESFLVGDLNGANALSISEIQNNSPDIYSQYTKSQSDNGIIYIDPDNSIFKSIVQNAVLKVEGNNSFLIAKELFIWLKENTNYETHPGEDGSIQPAIITFTLGTGDCDDLSVLYICLCRSAGIPARFIRGYIIEENNDALSVVAHAWAEVFVGGNLGNDGWVPVECACESQDYNVQIYQNFGLESMGHLRVYTGYGTNDSFNRSLSGPSIKYIQSLVVKIESFIDVKNYIILESKELVVDKNNQRYYQ